MHATGRLHGLSFSLLRLLGLLTLVTASACAVSTRSPQPLRDLAVHVERSAGVPTGHMVFKPIPGAMSGKAEDVALFRSAGGAERFRIPLDALLDRIGEFAAITRRDASTPGELVSPPGLRMARIATFFEPDQALSGTRCSNFRTGLRGDWPAQAALVYVDRPGSVQGAHYVAPYILEYDLAFPAAGLYAISTVSLGGHLTMRVAAPESLVARVRPAPCAQRPAGRQAAR